LNKSIFERNSSFSRLKEKISKLPIHTNKSDSKNQKMEEKQQIRNKIAKIIDRLKNNSIDQKLSAQEVEQLEKSSLSG
jgi:hypothetical protein